MEHIKEYIIQEVLFENAKFSDSEKLHLQSCDFCQQRMREYEIFFQPGNFVGAADDECIVTDEKMLRSIMVNIRLVESKRQISNRHVRRIAAVISGLFIASALVYFTFLNNPASNPANDNVVSIFIIIVMAAAGIALHLTDILNSYVIKKILLS